MDIISNCNFKTEDGALATVEYTLLKEDDCKRPYGVQARLFVGDELSDTACARERFFTEQEAKAVIDCLCRNRVTPCTLEEIL